MEEEYDIAITSLVGTIPARALYMTALEVTKSNMGNLTSPAMANAVAGLSAAMAAQLVWALIDVISQRLMVQGRRNRNFDSRVVGLKNYNGGIDAFRKILHSDGAGLEAVVAVQGLSASMASGVSALVTMPLDTIKTRLQVLDGEESLPTVLQTVRNLVKEGGLGGCYRGLGPRWASMSISATTMITTYEFLKRLSTKNVESFA
ncbi:hypothetical protein DH2020_046614 [Rehmannia glutinosa]|uniref:Uncharacterized protein n=1 Tax=Rehmannia glutinosa TaxID=99300 RepID=A0ABR0UAT3_REHGL